jgi:hypothetical protein
MDWATAIEMNRQSLIRIVAGLIAMVGIVEFMPRPLYLAVSRVLRPAEAAVRRLIVGATRGLAIKPMPVRPMPQGLAFAGKRSEGFSFQLFDSRPSFGRPHAPRAEPRIRVLDPSPLIPLFQARPVTAPAAPKPDPHNVSARRLCRRLAAIKLALDDLPRQARRLLRWQARRDRMQSPRFRTPLRPGGPPYLRGSPEAEIDFVLQACHGLARDAHLPDT